MRLKKKTRIRPKSLDTKVVPVLGGYNSEAVVRLRMHACVYVVKMISRLRAKGIAATILPAKR